MGRDLYERQSEHRVRNAATPSERAANLRQDVDYAVAMPRQEFPVPQR